MNVKRDEFLNALKLASIGVNNKETAAQSSFFMFIDDAIVGDNEVLHSHVKFKTGITGAVKAEELMAILNKMSAPAIEMEQVEDSLVFKVGRSKTGLTIYPLLREKVAYLHPKDNLGKDGNGWDMVLETNTEVNISLEACAPCCSANLTNRALSAVYLHSSGMLACDNFQAISAQTELELLNDSDYAKGTLLLPAFAVKPMMEIGFTHLWVNQDLTCYAINDETKNWIMFEAIDHREIEYPDITFLFDGEGKELEFPEGFLNAVKKAEVFAKNSLKSEEVYVQISIKDNMMTVRGEGANGFYQEEFDYESNLDFSFVAAPRTLEFLISKEDCSAELIVDEEMPRIKFYNDNFTYAITIEEAGA